MARLRRTQTIYPKNHFRCVNVSLLPLHTYRVIVNLRYRLSAYLLPQMPILRDLRLFGVLL